MVSYIPTNPAPVWAAGDGSCRDLETCLHLVTERPCWQPGSSMARKGHSEQNPDSAGSYDGCAKDTIAAVLRLPLLLQSFL